MTIPVKPPYPDKADFLVRVEGEYFEAPKEGYHDHVIKPYVADFFLPESAMESALSVIKNNLLGNKLKSKYPGFVQYRTHTITKVWSVKTGQASNNPNHLSFKELVEFIKTNGYPIKTELHKEVETLRDAFKHYQRNPEEFSIDQQLLQERIGDSVALEKELNALNEFDLESNQDNGVSVLPSVDSEQRDTELGAEQSGVPKASKKQSKKDAQLDEFAETD